jgi:hypothetical protein
MMIYDVTGYILTQNTLQEKLTSTTQGRIRVAVNVVFI